MSHPSILSLFTGYGGLDAAVEALTGGSVVAVSDISPASCAVLTARRPGVPNLGDITVLDPETLPEFSVLTGGYPCQPFSAAGKRQGADDPRHLWPHVLRVIQARRPDQVFLENVRGHLSLGFTEVVQDLTEAGYAVRWSVLAAGSVGAPHRRERVYIYATPDPDPQPLPQDAVDALPRNSKGGPKMWPAGCAVSGHLVKADRVDSRLDLRFPGLLPTPTARDHKGPHMADRQGGRSLADVTALFPTPTASDGNKARSNPSQARRNSPPLSAVAHLLPTPRAMDASGGRTTPREDNQGLALKDAPVWASEGYYSDWSPYNTAQWGKFAPAVARWSLILGREAPTPVQPSRTGKPQLAGPFTEWMMGLPEGYISGEDLGLSRSNVLTLSGNGVVPQAALAAYSALV